MLIPQADVTEQFNILDGLADLPLGIRGSRGLVHRVGANGVRFCLDLPRFLLGEDAFLNHQVEQWVARFLAPPCHAGGKHQAGCEKSRCVEALKH